MEKGGADKGQKEMAHTAKSDGRFGRSQKSEHILRSCPWASDGKCDSLDLNRLASRRSAQLEVACGYQSMDWMVLSLKELELLGRGRVVQRDDTSLLLESHDSIRFQNWIIILLYNCICRGTESDSGSLDSLLVRAPDSWSKGCKFESRQKRRENFLLQSQLCVLTLIRCTFNPRVTPVARKRPRSSCQKRRWQITPKHT